MQRLESQQVLQPWAQLYALQLSIIRCSSKGRDCKQADTTNNSLYHRLLTASVGGVWGRGLVSRVG